MFYLYHSNSCIKGGKSVKRSCCNKPDDDDDDEDNDDDSDDNDKQPRN